MDWFPIILCQKKKKLIRGKILEHQILIQYNDNHWPYIDDEDSMPIKTIS